MTHQPLPRMRLVLDCASERGRIHTHLEKFRNGIFYNYSTRCLRSYIIRHGREETIQAILTENSIIIQTFKLEIQVIEL